MTYKYIIDSKLIAYFLIQRKQPITSFWNKIANELVKFPKGDVVICGDLGHSDFRLAEQSYYKGHRRSQLAKKSQAEIDEHIKFNANYVKVLELLQKFPVTTLAVHGVEADDLASLYVEQFKDSTTTRIILITGDMDWLHFVVGSPSNVKLYDFNNDILYGVKEVIEKYALRTRREFSVLKSIVGDTSDNIKFVKQLGDVKGRKIFDELFAKNADPDDDHIITRIEQDVHGKNALCVHPLHVKDGRETVREAFLSNMSIADPFTDLTKLNDAQREQTIAQLSQEPLKVAEITYEELTMFGIQELRSPIFLTDNAKKVFNVKN